MPSDTFGNVERNAGSGGPKVARKTIVQGGTTITLPVGMIAWSDTAGNTYYAGEDHPFPVQFSSAIVLGAGTDAIGKLVANDGVDIGDVTINNASGAGAVNIQDGGNSITVDGSITVSQTNSFVSTNNSSSATLTANSTFTGTAEDVSHYASISVQVKASHASATNGLSLQFSIDGTNWDFTTSYTISAAAARWVAVPRQARYFRVVYTNGGTNQTYMRLQTVFSTMALTVPVTIDTELPAAAALSDTLSNFTTTTAGAANLLWDSATSKWVRAKGNATDGALVYLGANNLVKISDGTNTASVRSLAANALNVAIVDGSGNHVTSFGGGTQYAEGTTAATITGTAMMWEDTSDTLRAVSAAKPLPVNIVSGSSAGTEYNEGDVDATIAGVAILWEDTGDTLATVSTAKPLPISDAGGSLTVDGAVAVSNITACNTDAVVIASGTVTTVSTVTSLSQWAGNAIATNTGNASAGTLRVVLATDQPAVPVSGTFWQATQPVSISTAVSTNESPDATSAFCPSNSDSTAYEASRVVKASAGVVFSITGYNSKTSAQFVQIHNTTSVPSDTAVPVVVFRVEAQSNFYWEPGNKFGKFFATGITLCNSSTGPTKTIGSADCWFNVSYK